MSERREKYSIDDKIGMLNSLILFLCSLIKIIFYIFGLVEIKLFGNIKY